MKSNEHVMSTIKLPIAQKLIFKLMAQIQYGQIHITDANGTYFFCGDDEKTSHTVQIQVHNTRLYQLLLLNGSLAAGETYVQGYWDVSNLALLIEIIIKNTEIFNKIDGPITKLITLLARVIQPFKKNNIRRSKKNILAHYDLSNEFFQQFLDPSMMYSCALYEPENISLHEASIKKMERICQQLDLKPTDHLLEIGSGWGGFAIYATQKYQCKITTTTISEKQYAYVKQRIQQLQLQDRIELLNLDYRQLTGKYDKLVSIEMIEAVGYDYFDSFFKQCHALLKASGLFFLQAILINDQAYERAKNEMDFIRKYIFPGGCLPSMHAITRSMKQHAPFQLLQFRDIGAHYATTLEAWLNNFNQHVDEIKNQHFSAQFIRLWEYYLCYCIAAFRQAHITSVHALWRKRI